MWNDLVTPCRLCLLLFDAFVQNTYIQIDVAADAATAIYHLHKFILSEGSATPTDRPWQAGSQDNHTHLIRTICCDDTLG